ncbi:putative tRNA pseudouridine synthase 2 [Eufriesea mexicana]|uniref:Putative tRNA pseudouridine synthase 2 n=1 Tax=Eufriesea mexicana TaxID=516756 RepID=A0A310SVC9_9HYME|nr:PREDICTED: probable tRNA pseudouridine synthase 2 [Eufriesea mexicana]OAD61836.1 putative tRNA pseudouridine synthase 2 [Eufriesea mexicana]
MSANVPYKYVTNARQVYKALNGIFIVYKPVEIWFHHVRQTIINNLCEDLNNMHVRPPKKYVTIDGETNKNMKVSVQTSLADYPLVVGPRYQPNDFKLAVTKILYSDVSGVIVCGINKGIPIIHKLRESKSIRFYKVKGLLGQATDNYFHNGKIVEKSTYAHVRRGHIDKLCSSMQSSHQRKMFEHCGVDIQSQAAYELAVQGPIRPTNSNIPIIYTIKCIHFSPPEFTLEIVCTNEYDNYLKAIIHDLGMQLRTTATCMQILCIQDGLFHIKHALLQKYWTLEEIIRNMEMCKHVIDQNENILDPKSPALVKPKYAPIEMLTTEQLCKI